MFTTRATILSTLLGSATVYGIFPGSSLGDCLSFANKFDNTCSSLQSPVNLASHSGSRMECTGDDIRCPAASGKSDYTS